MSGQQTAKSNVAEMPQHSLIKTMAGKYGIEANTFKATVIKTLFPSANQNPSNEQVAAFLVVANQYNLNPFIKEIYAFPSQGGIVPIVSIDGWNTIINRQPQYDGVEFKDELDEGGKLIAITAKVYRKDRSHPTMVTEYLSECSRNTDPWKKYPSRMLRHKALIQAARYAFGLSGIYDPDEAERIAESTANAAEVVPIAVITEEQRTALVNLAQAVGVVEKLGAIVTGCGFDMLAHITVDRYDEVENAIREAAIPDAEVIEAEPVIEDHADESITAPEPPDEDVVDADEMTAIDPEESRLEDLRSEIKQLLTEKVGGMASDQKKFLKGRQIDSEPAIILQEMLEDLRAL